MTACSLHRGQAGDPSLVPIRVIAHRLRWWRRGKRRQAWHSAKHDKVFAPVVASTGGLWASSYRHVSASISIRHVYSSGVLAARWQLCQDSLKSAGRVLTWSINRKPPTVAADQNLSLQYISLSLSLSTYIRTSLSTKFAYAVYSYCIFCFSLPQLASIHLFAKVCELSHLLTHLTIKGLDLHQHIMLPLLLWQRIIPASFYLYFASAPVTLQGLK